MKKFVMVVLAALLVMVTFTACSTDPTQSETSASAPETVAAESSAAESPADSETDNISDITVGIAVYDDKIPFCSDLGAAAIKACTEKGYKYLILDGQGDQQKQQVGVEDWIATNSINALIVEVIDSKGSATLMDECKQADITVIAVDTNPNSSVPIAVVQSDNNAMGQQDAQAALDYLKEKNGSYTGTVITVGFDEAETMYQRVLGFKSVISEQKDITLVEYQAQSSSVTAGQSLCEDFLVTYPEGEIDVIFAANSALSDGVIAAQEAAGRKDFIILGIDDDNEELAALARDTSTFTQTIAQEPYSMGKDAVDILEKFLNGEEFETTVAAETSIITRDNVQEYIDNVASIKADLDQYRK